MEGYENSVQQGRDNGDHRSDEVAGSSRALAVGLAEVKAMNTHESMHLSRALHSHLYEVSIATSKEEPDEHQ